MVDVQIPMLMITMLLVAFILYWVMFGDFSDFVTLLGVPLG